jgi:hypothetical protein
LWTVASLGMDEKSLAKRSVMLEGLRARLTEPVAPKHRTVLKAPQKLLLEAGEVLIYPVCQPGPFVGANQSLRCRQEMAWVMA